MKKENGRNGQAVRNKNGTYDLGVMQINTLWLPTLSKYGYTKQDLRFDGCRNVMVGTWILANSLAHGKTIWSGVGDYHSHTANFNLLYRTSVRSYHQALSIVIDKPHV